MTTTHLTVKLPRLHFAQINVSRTPARFKVLCCGRRWGKTTFIIHEVISALLEGKRVAYVSPSSTDASYRAVWRDMTERTAQITQARNATTKTIKVITGGVFALYTFNAIDRLRGDTAGWDYVALDEVAFAPNLAQAWSNVVRPALADRQGHAVIASTPKGLNDFYALYQRGLGGDDASEWCSFHYPSMSNPHVPSTEWDAMRDELTQAGYAQEIEAQFIEGAGAVFRGVDEVSILEERQPYKGRFVFGVDWGRDNDYTVISVLDTVTRHQVAMERFNQISWDVQQARLVSLFKQWRPETIIAEQNSIGSVNIDALRALDIPVVGFNTTNSSKRQIIDALALAIERREITLLNNAVQRHELTAFAQRRTASGSYQFGAPAGGHDDTVMALAIALHGCDVAGFRVARLDW